MRHDAPAALPLLALVAGLTLAPAMCAGIPAVPLLAVAATLAAFAGGHGRAAAIGLLAFAAGIGAAQHRISTTVTEDRSFAGLDATRFADIEAPLDRGWSKRGEGYLLRVNRFSANGISFTEPLAVYARFVPAEFANASTLRARGFLHRSETGSFSLAVKSPRLLQYTGELSRLDPARWNRALAARLEPLAARHPDEVALVQAIALGHGERLSDAMRASFRRGGTYHLLVFSGLQIAAAAGFLALLLRWLRAPRTADWLLVSFAVISPLFIGPTASVSRASVGIGLYALARILGRPTSVENLWCVAGLLWLLVLPSDLTNVAFQLTYAGAGALLFAARKRPLAALIVAELAITPLTLFHFHQYALGGSLVTLLMTPLVFVMLVISAIAFAIPAAVVLIAPVHALCVALNDLGSVTYGFHRAPPVLALATGWGLALAAVAFSRGTRRAVAIVLALCIPAAGALMPVSHAYEEVIALDVGQGDSIVVRAGGTTLLVDGGGRSGSESFGEATLLPLLVDRGIQRLDAVVLTHAHPDHCGGLPAVVEHLKVGELWVSPRRFSGECAGALLAAAMRTQTPIHLVHDSDRFISGLLDAKAILAPGPFRRSPENNGSIVLEVQVERHRILLTGDVERDAEARLLGRGLQCDIIKIPHHGSRTSSTSPFLDEAAPKIALVSAGRRNLFGHPHPEILAALARRGIHVWRTDRSGTVTIRMAGRHLFPAVEIDTSN